MIATRCWLRGTVACLSALVVAPLGAGQPPAEPREVRQLVTFRFLPGQTDAVVSLYATQLLPIYRDVEAMRTVRLFREVESPEPLDLMVVTHYEGMAGMDRANQALSRSVPDRPSIGQLYRQISDLSLGHTDQFVELLSPPTVSSPGERVLDVLEFVRVSPGMGPIFERTVLGGVHAWEQETETRDLVLRTETSRFLIADGWDYLRNYTVRNLAAWHAYATARARHPAVVSAHRLVEARKTMVLGELTELRVR